MDSTRESEPAGTTIMPALALLLAVVGVLSLATGGGSRQVRQARGVDPRVDYAALTRLGPWDDRNYALTVGDLALLPDDEAAARDAIPAFYRVELRRRYPGARTGRYPLSALNRFFIEHGGYLVDGWLYRDATRREGRFVVATGQDAARVRWAAGPDGDAVAVGAAGAWRGAGTRSGPSDPGAKALLPPLEGEARVTTPEDAAESAVAINPVDPDLVIAGVNGPAGAPFGGQSMWYSTDGGASWSAAAALPLGGTCCDPTVAWSADGSKAYAATLGPDEVWFYRSADGGQTWDDLATVTPGDPRRELRAGPFSADKEYLHVDVHPTSPHVDNLYMTWNEDFVLHVARSTDGGSTWDAPVVFPTTKDAADDLVGIGGDLTTDAAGNVYHFWPGTAYGQIWVARSTDGGATFPGPFVMVADVESVFFPIPSQETRETGSYVSADVDRSGGPGHGRIYVAWSDATGPTTDDPLDNHARVQVAFSDDGSDWTVVTPHETADQLTVDRWQPWLRVGPDGAVHVVFYDTRRDPARTSVDRFHAMSLDGGVTWSAPRRLTSVASPNVGDAFDFGDYQGMDLVLNRLVAIFTDNRHEAAGSGDSRDVYVAGLPTGNVGWVLDGFGGVHAGGGSRALSPGTPYFGFDAARDLELDYPGFHVLDGFGGLHAGGGATALGGTPYFGFDVARDLEVAAAGHYVLDGFGGLHAGGGATLPAPTTPYFGTDVARDLELAPTGLYVLDAFGGVHAGGGAPVPTPGTPYFGFDIARDLELAAPGHYVLDGLGGLHAGGGAPPVSPAPAYFGFDAARDLELVVDGVLVLDSFGGVHAGGGTRDWSPATPWFGFPVARDLEVLR